MQIEAFAADSGAAVYVSDGVCLRTECGHRVICVHGVPTMHYELDDRAAQAHAMVMLFESGHATQEQIALAFGYSTRSLHRYQGRFESGGIVALTRGAGRPVGSVKSGRKARGRDRTLLHLKEKGLSNRAIAARLGVVENAVRKRLKKLGWKVQEPTNVPLPLPLPDRGEPITQQSRI